VAAGNYTSDIDNQGTDNYDYDAIGNLTRDTKEGISNITWSVYGKILSVTKNSGTITYTYDASGNRISKTFSGKTTWYVRDASGNVMAVYEQRSDLNSGHLTQSEVHLYGSSRLGIWNRNQDLVNPPLGEITIFEGGKKLFELTNHLGNVLVTISDRKLPVQNGTTGTVAYDAADVVSANDNYVFGMTMPGRNYQSDKYRYGFNGKEKDNSTGEGNLDFGARIYDSRISRWLAVDPLQVKFPHESPYIFVGNNPVFFVDVKGKFMIGHLSGKDREAAIKVIEAIRNEVDSWKDESDPRFQAFQAATGVPDIKFIKNKILKDDKGPEFNWGNHKTFKAEEGSTLSLLCP
jgi:RHS repeat-associated protein